MAGATLVPKPAGPSLLGTELARFLQEKHITALCCVPTLLATLDEDLPGLRFLLVSGEACPRDLVARWHRPGRPLPECLRAHRSDRHRDLGRCSTPNKPVTLGVPLPTYSAVILDPEEARALPPGESGKSASPASVWPGATSTAPI